MPIVQSFGVVQSFTPTPAAQSGAAGWSSSNGLSLYGDSAAYAELYARQPNVRTCVDFLARNIAQLALHVYRRVSDTDRMRLSDHQLATWLKFPNPSTTSYRLFQSLMGDMGIYFNAYLLKVRYQDIAGRPQIGLVRLPPEEMFVAGGLLPTEFVWTANGQRKTFALSEVMHFAGYNPLNHRMGLSPLETLRRILAEEAAAGESREIYWRNHSRKDGVIEIQKDAPKYSDEQLQRFREQWSEFSLGGNRAGMTAIIPRGLSFKDTAFSARDSEYLSARKLTREECAAAYHIPLPMVGILEHATFSNIKEQHKQLYQDSLGPWLEMLQQEFEAQLLPECEDTARVYLEFNIADKLKGSFEEQAASLQSSVGRPIMTANEGRARINLPAIKNDPSADQLAAQQGGPAASGAHVDTAGADGIAAVVPVEDGDPSVADALHTWQARLTQRLNKVSAGDRAATFDTVRWGLELAEDLTPLIGADQAQALAARITFLKHQQLKGAVYA
jgi:HK97 family phage portal protein